MSMEILSFGNATMLETVLNGVAMLTTTGNEFNIFALAKLGFLVGLVIVGVGAAACCTVARGWPCVERVRRMPVGFGADDAGSSDRPAGAGGGPPAVRDAGVAGRSGDQGLSTRRHTGIRRVNWP